MTAVQVGRWYPDIAPALPDESDTAYTGRIAGTDGTGRVPYDHRRGRECSMAFHLTCSRWHGGDSACECPCHSDPGVQGVEFVPNPEPARRLATLYHLPAHTAERVIHLAEQAVENGTSGLEDLRLVLGAAYYSIVGECFATDVAWLLDYDSRLDGCPPKPRRPGGQ